MASNGWATFNGLILHEIKNLYLPFNCFITPSTSEIGGAMKQNVTILRTSRTPPPRQSRCSMNSLLAIIDRFDIVATHPIADSLWFVLKQIRFQELYNTPDLTDSLQIRKKKWKIYDFWRKMDLRIAFVSEEGSIPSDAEMILLQRSYTDSTSARRPSRW